MEIKPSASAGRLPSLKRTLKHFSQEINAIEAKINSDIDSDEGLKQKMTRLLAVKGIGPVSAYALIALLPELGKVSGCMQKASSKSSRRPPA